MTDEAAAVTDGMDGRADLGCEHVGVRTEVEFTYVSHLKTFIKASLLLLLLNIFLDLLSLGHGT